MTSRTPGCDGLWRDVLLAVGLFIIVAQFYYILGGGSVPLHDSSPVPAISRLRLTNSQRPLREEDSSGMQQQQQPPVSRLDTACSLERPGVTCALFIMYSWNFELFWSSLQSYLAAGLGPRLIIIDNSANRRIVNDAKVAGLVGEVIPTRVQLTFSQLQNFMSDVAIERGLTYFFWGHADVALVASNETASFAHEVTSCMERVMTEDPHWGIVFFSYDWFAAFRTETVRHVRFDPFIHHYKSDCDFYPRVRDGGWSVFPHGAICEDTKVQVYDMKRPLELPLHNYARLKEVLEGEKDIRIDRNAWRRKEWSVNEQVGFDYLSQASDAYYRRKWGIEGKVDNECGWPEVISNTTGQRVLRQQPFQADT